LAALAILFVPAEPLAGQGQTPPTRTEAVPQEPRVRTGRESRGEEPIVRPADPEATLLRERAHLTRGWGGLRTWLEQNGITPTVTMLTDSSSVLAGGVERGDLVVRYLFDAEVEVDAERLFGLRGGRFPPAL
jgi:hypothetical protein